MDASELAVLVDELEDRVERLRALYDQYFMGIERLEPLILRKDVDRRLWQLRREQIRNTALRFKMQTTIQRYNTYQQYWQRICREIENGTYYRDVSRAAARFGEAALTAMGRKRQKMFEKGMERRQERDTLRNSGRPTLDAAGAKSAGPSAAPSTPSRTDSASGSVSVSMPAVPNEPLLELEDLADLAPFAEDLIATIDRPQRPPPSTSSSASASASRASGPARQSFGPPVLAAPRPASARPSPAPKPAAPAPVALPEGRRPSLAVVPPPMASPSARVPAIPRQSLPDMSSHLSPRAKAPPADQAGQESAREQSTLSAENTRVRPRERAEGPSRQGALRSTPLPGVHRGLVALSTGRPPPVLDPNARGAAESPTSAAPSPFPVSAQAAAGSPAQLAAGSPAQLAAGSPAQPAAGSPHALPAPQMESPRIAVPPAKNPGSAAERSRVQATRNDDLADGRIRQIYGAYVEAKRRCHESTAGITYERLSANLRRTATEIQAKHPGRQIDFEVIVKNGAAVLRPVVRR